LKQQGATIHDSVINGLSLPFAAVPVLPANVPGTTDVAVGNSKTVTLEPGQYRNVTVGQSGTLLLRGGIYQLQNLDLGTRSSILAMGLVEVHVRGELSASSRVTIANDPLVAAALPASQIVFWVAGEDSQCRHGGTHHGHESEAARGEHDEAAPAAVHIGNQSLIKANIAAPRGTVSIQAKASATGAFIGARVRIGTDSRLTLDSAFD
jgi:hypothetical protein